MSSHLLHPPRRCSDFPLVQCNYTYSLWFPQPFSTPPFLFVTPRNSCTNCPDTYNVTTMNVTETGFDIVVRRTDPGSFGNDWA